VGALARVDHLAERLELAVTVRAEADAQHQAPVTELIQGHGLARELVHAAAGERRDQRAKGDSVGRGRGGGKGDPGVGDGPHRRSVADVIPEEEAVPAAGLGARRELGEQVRVGELVERGGEDCALGAHRA
jgi:hypothetical protein